MKDVALHTWRFEQSFSFDGCLCIGSGGCLLIFLVIWKIVYGMEVLVLYCSLIRTTLYIQMREVLYKKIFTANA